MDHPARRDRTGRTGTSVPAPRPPVHHPPRLRHNRPAGRERPVLHRRFIAHVNIGLAGVPEARVRPHQFRKTMSVICSREPDGEIALGIQLKRAARRILANPTTHSYAAPDGAQ